MTTSTPSTEPPRLSVGVAIDVGRSRKGKPNQDSLGSYQDYVNNPVLLRTKGLLFVVADGMGGAAGGKEASETAVQSIIQGYYDDDDPNPQVCLEHAIQAANTEIGQIGRADPNLRGLGTTLVVTLIMGQRLLVANVGDSRVYLYRRGRLRQISLDHTVVQEHLRAGLMTPEEAMVHPRRHVLSRNLGSRPEAQPDYAMETLQLGDIVLLCSDGLWGPVSEYEIGQLLQQETQTAAEALIERANAQGGPDNISAVVVRVDAWGAAAEAVRSPITQPITQPLVEDPTPRAAPATVLIDQPAEPADGSAASASVPSTPQHTAAPAAPASVPSTPQHAAASAATQRMVSPPAPPLAAAASNDLRDKIGEPPAATPPPRKHAAWMIPAIVGGIILAIVLAFVVVRPVAAPTTVGVGATAVGTLAVAPTQASPATPDAVATTNAATNAPTVAVAAPDATVRATETVIALPTVTREPTSSLANTTLPVTIPAETTLPTNVQPAETASAIATTEAGSGGGVSAGDQAEAPRAAMVFTADGSALSLDADGEVTSWSPVGGQTVVPLLTAGQNITADDVRGTLAGANEDGSMTRLRVTADGVVSDTVVIDDPATRPLPITDAMFSPDGSSLVYATTSGAIRFWSEANGKSELLSTHSQNRITSIEWSRDGSLVATATDGGTIEIWNENGQKRTQIERNTNILALTFDPTNAVLALLTDEENMQVITLENGELSQLLAPSASWSSLAFDTTGTLLTAAAQDGTLLVWRDPLTPNASEQTVENSDAQPIAMAAFTPDNQRIAALAPDGTVRFLPVSSP